MKKTTTVIALLLALVLSLGACTVPLGEEYTVRFVLGGGRADVVTELSPTSRLYEPEPPAEGYVFAGWFTDAALTRPYLRETVSEDMTLYARFLPLGDRVVTFIYDNGQPDATLTFSGAVAEPKVPVREGHVFTGWTDASTGKLFAFGSVPSAPLTVLRAGWREMSDGVVLTVHPENGEESTEVGYAYAAIPTEPSAPENGELDFTGWYADADCRIPFDFDAPLTADAHVYAGWGVDLATLANRIAEEALPATVKIHTTRTNAALISKSIGSGVIYASHGGYYYLLTNEHVVAPQSGFGAPSYKIYDAYGNEYQGQRMAMDASYDLAVLRFAVGAAELAVAELAKAEAQAGSTIVSVGNPGDKINTVTFGEVTKYGPVDVSGISVGFDVGWHDSPIANGSSGGAVFNSEVELVGINFAAATHADGSFAIGAFIPLTHVCYFLTENNLVFG